MASGHLNLSRYSSHNTRSAKIFTLTGDSLDLISTTSTKMVTLTGNSLDLINTRSTKMFTLAGNSLELTNMRSTKMSSLIRPTLNIHTSFFPKVPQRAAMNRRRSMLALQAATPALPQPSPDYDAVSDRVCRSISPENVQLIQQIGSG